MMTQHPIELLSGRKLSKKPYSDMVTITPEQAGVILDRFNTANRVVSSRNVRYLSRQLSEGKWQLNGESLKFGTDGELLDGQHRLMACIDSRVPITTLVTYNVPSSSKHTMDTGRMRSAKDVLSFSLDSPKYVSHIAAAAKFVIKFEAGQYSHSSNRSTNPDNSDILSFCESNPEFQGFVEEYSRVHDSGDRLATKAICNGLYWIISRRSPEMASDFFMRMSSGEGLKSGDPLHTLRKRLYRAKAQGSNRDFALTHREMVKLIVVAWNAHISGASPRSFVYRGDVPKIRYK